ncbi:MAG: tRNA preQ1(34) S-adenosylmethionine ribosyltransferase-isomerase QueA [Bacillota bacterium]
MRRSDFDYELPAELIAQEPSPTRDTSRLLVVQRDREGFEHRVFRDIQEYLVPGDILVLNETKVLPVRLYGIKEGTGGRVELLLLRALGGDTWEVLIRPGRRTPPGTRLWFGAGLLKGEILERTESGGRVVRFSYRGLFEEVLRHVGHVPLPPYIKKELSEPGRYQTVYARQPGSAAAPTAGLHFTPELLARVRDGGVETASLVLHIGLDTFRPVRVEDITEHRMHREEYDIPGDTAAAVNRAKSEKRRVIAVGTTTVRCLEAASGATGEVRAGAGTTDLFIYPGYRFRVVDVIITNFHLPCSSLLIMIAAFAGREKILRAYREAVRLKYRFFSFGDAMVII